MTHSVLNMGKYSIDMVSYDRTDNDNKLRNLLKTDGKTGQTEYNDIKLYTKDEWIKKMKDYIAALNNKYENKNKNKNEKKEK